MPTPIKSHPYQMKTEKYILTEDELQFKCEEFAKESSAPYLLEALQNICSCCDGNNPDHEIFYFTAKAAIDKALGNTEKI